MTMIMSTRQRRQPFGGRGYFGAFKAQDFFPPAHICGQAAGAGLGMEGKRRGENLRLRVLVVPVHRGHEEVSQAA